MAATKGDTTYSQDGYWRLDRSSPLVDCGAPRYFEIHGTFSDMPNGLLITGHLYRSVRLRKT